MRFEPGPHDHTYLAEGHGHGEAELREALATALAGTRNQAQARQHADVAALTETWYSEDGGFGHDCSPHQDVPRHLWSPHCGTFRPVTVAVVQPATAVERAH